jgi:RNA recognition motif-containing protein
MSNKKLYVGNLPFSLDDNGLAEIFAEVGTVASARVVLDPNTGRKRGFGFVEMSSEEEAQRAVDVLNDRDVAGRPMRVDIARERERTPREGGGGGYQGGGQRRRKFGGGGGNRGGGYDNRS